MPPAPTEQTAGKPPGKRGFWPHAQAKPAIPAPALPPGAGWLYGTHAVLAALANPRRRCRRLVVCDAAVGAAIGTAIGTDDADADGAIAAAAASRGIEAEVVERATLDRWLPGSAVHQGLALMADGLPEQGLEVLLDAAPRPPSGRVVALVLDQVTDARNVGAMLRTAAAFGAAAMVVQTRHAPEPWGALAKAASGAVEQVPYLREVNIARALAELRQGGFLVVGLDATAEMTLADALAAGPEAMPQRVALVLGAEDRGLRPNVRDHCARLARLPMADAAAGIAGIDSLNVSVAAGVALYELARAGASGS
ncbi:MAG: RNA methyltransferase [Alphaproteobacteria bacterium]|nr:RNA methyltransferase [Alphaproteobacteria bacterium]